MKRLIVKLVLPLTIFSFIIINKWWYVLVIDGADEIMYGFPLIYTCRGFGTSMSHQFFILEFLLDLLTYFLFWFIFVYLVDRFLFTIKMHKILSISLMTTSGILIGFVVYFASSQEIFFLLKRDFEIEKMETGYNFIWQEQVWPDYHDYHPGNK